MGDAGANNLELMPSKLSRNRGIEEIFSKNLKLEKCQKSADKSVFPPNRLIFMHLQTV